LNQRSQDHTKDFGADLTIAVPVYSRPNELRQLLASVGAMDSLPAEIVLSEDGSPERPLLRDIALQWSEILGARGCQISFFENEKNLGYDGNVRSLFEKATRRWVMLLGNDDIVLPGACEAISKFTNAHHGVHMCSRTFVRFRGDPTNHEAVSRISDADGIFDQQNSDPGMLFRSTAFFGGLVVDREWAKGLATDVYDGTLYYQVYLACHAFIDGGIGYVASPLVGGRAGNTPMFGSASSESGTHTPGSYSPSGRAAMWRGVLRICSDVERSTGIKILDGVRRELDSRQSFHIFEMMANQGRSATLQTARQFRELGLMRAPMSWVMFLSSLILGKHALWAYSAARRLLQRQ
jgi:hypothetical protein